MPLLHTAHLEVHPEAVAPCRDRLTRHAAISAEREAGCLSFDIYQDRDEPTRFLLVEVYADDAALALHRQSPHYLAFRRDVENWVVSRKWWFWNAAGDADDRAASDPD